MAFGADPVIKDGSGNTGLHIAAASRSPDCLKILAENVRNKDDINELNEFGMTSPAVISMTSLAVLYLICSTEMTCYSLEQPLGRALLRGSVGASQPAFLGSNLTSDGLSILNPPKISFSVNQPF